MSNLMNKAGRALGYLGGGLTLLTFAQGIQSNKQNKAILEQLENRIKVQQDLISAYESQIKKGNDFTNLSSKVVDINEEIKKSLLERNKLAEISKKMEELNLDQF